MPGATADNNTSSARLSKIPHDGIESHARPKTFCDINAIRAGSLCLVLIDLAVGSTNKHIASIASVAKQIFSIS
jgi:hypothetical protein